MEKLGINKIGHQLRILNALKRSSNVYLEVGNVMTGKRISEQEIELGKQIGRGAYGVVYSCSIKNSPKIYALVWN